jgi:hypothetical protein
MRLRDERSKSSTRSNPLHAHGNQVARLSGIAFKMDVKISPAPSVTQPDVGFMRVIFALDQNLGFKSDKLPPIIKTEVTRELAQLIHSTTDIVPMNELIAPSRGGGSGAW